MFVSCYFWFIPLFYSDFMHIQSVTILLCHSHHTYTNQQYHITTQHQTLTTHVQNTEQHSHTPFYTFFFIVDTVCHTISRVCHADSHLDTIHQCVHRFSSTVGWINYPTTMTTTRMRIKIQTHIYVYVFLKSLRVRWTLYVRDRRFCVCKLK